MTAFRPWRATLVALLLLALRTCLCQALEQSGDMHSQEEERVRDQHGISGPRSLDAARLIRDMVRGVGSHLGESVDPTLGGRMPPTSASAETAIREWMDENGESVVGTRAGPFEPTDHYVTTYRDGRIYVHVLDWNGKNNLLLPAVTDRVVTNAWIMGDEAVDGSSWGLARQHPWGLLLVLPSEFHSGVDDIVVLDIEGDPAELQTPRLVEADPSAVVRLFGDSAKMSGGPCHLPAQDWIEGWKTPGDSASWKVSLLQAYDYTVAITYAAGERAAGATFEIAVGSGELVWEVRETGAWLGEEQGFEKIPLEGALRLPAGTSTITLRRVGEVKRGEVVRVHSLELISPPAQQAMIVAKARARKIRAGADWLVGAKYGVMFHWSTTTQPLRGPQKPYPEAVSDFDVDALVDIVTDTGAGYVVFTAVHGIMHFPAPLKSVEQVMAQRTCKRDLIAEIADKLHERGIPLILYFHHGVGDADWVKAAGFLSKDKSRFFRIERSILTEIGHRYGERVAGYWFDDRYPLQPFEDLYGAARAGNANRIVAFNSWILPKTTEFQDYYAGELGGALLTPTASYFAEGGGAGGLQPHGLIFLDDQWQHGYPDTDIAPPLFTNERIIEYVEACIARGLPITMNISITQDGEVSPQTLEQMRALRQAIRRE